MITLYHPALQVLTENFLTNSDDQEHGKLPETSVENTKLPIFHKQGLTKRLIMVTLLTSFGSSLQLGYNHWVVNHPASFIQDFYNSTYHQKKKIQVEENIINLMNSLTVAVYFLGGMIGSLLTCPLVDKRGRKGALVICNCLAIVSATLLGFTTMVNSYEYIIFSRLITGICSGMLSFAVPLYLSELAPRKRRGSIIVTSFAFVGLGTLISQIICLPEVLGSIKDWSLLLAGTGILALFQIIILPTFPESPRYLLIQKKDEGKAREALNQLRDKGEVEAEIDEMYQEDYGERTEKTIRGIKLIVYRGVRWQVMSVIIAVCGQQMSGITAASYYLRQTITGSWLSEKESLIYLMMTMILSTATLFILIFIIDRIGRKILLLTGYGAISILCILLTMTIELQITISWMTYVTLILLVLFFMGYLLGPGPVTLIVTAELFLQSSRATGIAIGGILYWCLAFLTEMLFMLLENQVGSYSFLIFWPICIATFIYIFKFLPETKSKTFLEIKRYISTYMAKKIKVKEKESKNRSSHRRKRTGSTKKRSKKPMSMS